MTEQIKEMTAGRREVRVEGQQDFSLVTYNILADCHMKPDW